MRLLLCCVLLALPAFAANFPSQVSVLLDVGATMVTINNSGTSITPLVRIFKPGASQRIRYTIIDIYAPDALGSTYTACADPCSVSIWRDSGQQYERVEYVDNSGAEFSPRKFSQMAGAYKTSTCGGLGTLPQVEPAATSTAPLPMPREVLGQDCYVEAIVLPLISGHASTGLRLWGEFHAPAYNSITRWDNKISCKVNNGPWLDYKNTNSALVTDDEMRFYSLATNSANTPLFSTPYKIGGYAQVRQYQMDLADGTIGSGDTTATIRCRFNGTEGQGSGFRILAMNIIEADKTVSSISVTSNIATASVTANGYSSGETVLIRNGPGMYMRFSGLRTLTGVATDTITFAPCGTGNPACTSPNGPFALPVNRDPSGHPVMVQGVTRVARCIIAKSAFTDEDPNTWTAGPGNATTGENLFKFGNESGTAGQVDQLVSPNTSYLNDKFHFGTCGGVNGCHTFDGRDLKYMNMSNKALIERSRFHGMTYTQGQHIAAYIRGLPDPVYPNSRPWNPPYQPGPGLSAGTYKKSDSTLTSIAVSANLATFTVPGNHVYQTGQPVVTWGATVDTDLNKGCIITVTGATTFTCPTVSVANGTYTESTLQITSADKFFAGCGKDCVLNNGYADFLEYLAPGGDRSKWPWNNKIETRDLPYPLQFADYKFWLPAIHPADAFPSASFLTHAAHTYHQARLAGGANAITPHDFATYKTAGYALSDTTNYKAFGIDVVGALAGYPGGYLPDGKAGQLSPSIYPLLFSGISGRGLISHWELWHEYGLIALDGQKRTDEKGAASATGCYAPWGVPGQFFFNNGAHKFVMPNTGVFDGMISSYEYHSDIWYIAATTISFGNCWDSPNNPIDNAYYNAFRQTQQRFRPQGWTTFVPQLLSSQFGSQQPEFYAHNSLGQEGTDWSALFSKGITYGMRFSYWHFSTSEWTDWANAYLVQLNGITAAKTPTYWNEIFTQGGSAWDCTGGPAVAWSQASASPCNNTAMMLTFFKTWGVDATNLTTFLNWAKSIPSWSGHNFDADITAANDGIAPSGGDTGCTIGALPNYNFNDGTPKWWRCSNM